MRTHRIAKTIAAFAAPALLLTACGGEDGGSNDAGDSADSVYPGVTQLEVYEAMSVWGDGCEIFNDFQPLQDFLGVEEIATGALSPNDPAAGEPPSCMGQFHLALDGERNLGNADVQMTLRPFETDQEATDYYQERVEGYQGDKEDDEETAEFSEGELAGEWSESYYWTGNDGFSQTLDVYARYGNWVLTYFSGVGEDPGLEDGGDAYDFTLPEYVTYVTEEYLPGLKAEFDGKFEE